MNEKLFIKISKALADKNRLAILREISSRRTVSCEDLRNLVNLSQPTVSHHIKLLTDAELVLTEKDGRCLKLSVNQDQVDLFAGFLSEIKD
ncbi:MAG: ArsR/SmtB family transcription factor [Calditrichia bacterium]